jgi:hypothetical protein
MNAGDMEKLARMVAKETVAETFLMLGVNISTPEAVQSTQNQFATLRNIHYSMRQVRNVIIAGVLGLLVSGAGWAFWAGFKVSAAAPSTISAPGGSRPIP